MKGKKLSIDINFDEDSINPHFLDLQKKMASNIFHIFSSIHGIRHKNNYLYVKNIKFKIIKIFNSLNNVLYLIENNQFKFVLKKSRSILNANTTLLTFLNSVNLSKEDQQYWMKVIEMEIMDAFNEKKNCLNYEELYAYFKENILKSEYIYQGFSSIKEMKTTIEDCKIMLSQNYICKFSSPPSTIIVTPYLENSFVMRNMNFLDDSTKYYIYIILIYIFSFANLNGYYHNDLKSNNIMIVPNIHSKLDLNKLLDINVEIRSEFIPVIIDYSNSRKVNSCYPFDIYIISRMFCNNTILSECTCNEPNYLDENGIYINIVEKIVNLIEKTYTNIIDITTKDRLNSIEFFNNLGKDSQKFNLLIKEIFSLLKTSETEKIKVTL
ncbi:hypothetical protein CPAV1605_1297 [seawater metagenome]|uniref:Protein kinase domain-containing protein n=1 Tax=seawater metagenome TaxID=1561972 RepID=A0A5E8CM23_9ZZZZ